MPLYDYRCDKCDTPSTELRKAAEKDVPKDCDTPNCEGVVIRIPTAPNIRVKGGTPKFFGKKKV